MALQPIDLSTIYSQMDKVSQMTAAQNQAAVHGRQQDIDKASQIALEKSTSVQETAKNEVDSSKVKADGNGSGAGESFSQKNKKQEPEESEEIQPQFYEIRDPKLGQHIDITG